MTFFRLDNLRFSRVPRSRDRLVRSSRHVVHSLRGLTGVVLVAGAVHPLLAQAQAAVEQDTPERAPVNRALREQVAQLALPVIERGESVGIAVGILDAHGATHHFGFGQVAKGSGKAPDQDTLFEIGSITKCFTGILLAEMVLKDEVRLDDPVKKYLPRQVALPTVSGRPMTLEHLATYSSGLPRMPANFGRTPQENARYSREQLFEFLTNVARRERGEGAERHFLYSNLGFAVLGQCLAERAQQPIRPLLVNRVARRLGMESTLFEPGHVLENRVATVYAAGRRVPPWETGVIAPAGMLRSTTRDMVKFIEANVGRAETPLRPALELARQPRYQTGARDGSKASQQIGLAWFIKPNSGLVSHNGATAGSSSNVVFHPDRKIGVVVLMNQAKSPSTQLSLQILKLLQSGIDVEHVHETPHEEGEDVGSGP